MGQNSRYASAIFLDAIYSARVSLPMFVAWAPAPDDNNNHRLSHVPFSNSYCMFRYARNFSHLHSPHARVHRRPVPLHQDAGHEALGRHPITARMPPLEPRPVLVKPSASRTVALSSCLSTKAAAAENFFPGTSRGNCLRYSGRPTSGEPFSKESRAADLNRLYSAEHRA